MREKIDRDKRKEERREKERNREREGREREKGRVEWDERGVVVYKGLWFYYFLGGGIYFSYRLEL